MWNKVKDIAVMAFEGFFVLFTIAAVAYPFVALVGQMFFVR